MKPVSVIFLKERLVGSKCFPVGEVAEFPYETARRLIDTKVAAPHVPPPVTGKLETATVDVSPQETADLSRRPVAGRGTKK